MDNYSKKVILVDGNDKIVGCMNAVQAHLLETNAQHRAFSVFLFVKHNNKLKLLIQKRAHEKLVFPNLWSNTVCSHPFINHLSFTDPVLDCKQHALNRLGYELGLTTEKIKITDLILVERLKYYAENILKYNGSLLGIRNIISDVYDASLVIPEKEMENVDLTRFLGNKQENVFVENEIDYIFVSKVDIDKNDLEINNKEVSDFRFVCKEELEEILATDECTPWFKILYKYLDVFSFVN